MELIDIKYLYDSGQVARTIESGDTFLLGRPNVQRGDKYSVLVIDKADLVTYILAQVPAPPTPFTLPYKIYTALLTQSGTGAPTATILQNTLGVVPVWSYIAVGKYLLTATGIFSNALTVLNLQHDTNNFIYSGFDNNTIAVDTYSGGILSNDMLFGTAIEIKVYS